MALMAQSVAERQRAFKQAMKEAGFVRLEAYVTKEQREKFRRLGGDEWLRKKIQRAFAFPAKAKDVPDEQCFCDKQGLGEPNVSCGDCPTRDYKAKGAKEDQRG